MTEKTKTADHALSLDLLNNQLEKLSCQQFVLLDVYTSRNLDNTLTPYDLPEGVKINGEHLVDLLVDISKELLSVTFEYKALCNAMLETDG